VQKCSDVLKTIKVSQFKPPKITAFSPERDQIIKLAPLPASEEKTFRGFLALQLFADFCTCTVVPGFFGKTSNCVSINNVQNCMFSHLFLTLPNWRIFSVGIVWFFLSYRFAFFRWRSQILPVLKGQNVWGLPGTVGRILSCEMH
jgi:hypothetical protein